MIILQSEPALPILQPVKEISHFLSLLDPSFFNKYPRMINIITHLEIKIFS